MELKNYKEALESYNHALELDEKNDDYLNSKIICSNLYNQELLQMAKISSPEIIGDLTSVSSLIKAKSELAIDTEFPSTTSLNDLETKEEEIKQENNTPIKNKKKERKLFKLFKL
jgi:tetratricopeptide (TPR) repeat protein